MTGFWAEYWHVVGFYALVIISLFVFRKKFDWQGKVVGLLRTNWGVDWMNRFGAKYAKPIRGIGYAGIYVGFLGMITIIGFLIKGVIDLFINPNAPPTISPVLPGIAVPGSPIAFPLFETLIALFLVIVIHESAHGIVSAAHKVKVKASGLLVFGPIFGAFVEPDEEVVKKKSHNVQNSIFAAGPFSNVLFAILILIIYIGALFALNAVVTPIGFSFGHVVEGSPARAAGIPEDTLFVAVDGNVFNNSNSLFEALQDKRPGDELVLTAAAGTNHSLTLGAHPDDEERAWVGVEQVETNFRGEAQYGWLFAIVKFLLSTLQMTYVLSLGLGLANLLPLGPVDGGRMWQLTLHKWFGKERGDAIWSRTSVVVLMIVVLLLVVPIIRALFSGVGV